MVYTKPWNPFIATRTFLLLVKWHNHRCKLNTSCSLSVKKLSLKPSSFSPRAITLVFQFSKFWRNRFVLYLHLIFLNSTPSNDINSRKNGNVEFVKCPWKNPFFSIAKDKCLSWLDVFWLSAEHLNSYLQHLLYLILHLYPTIFTRLIFLNGCWSQSGRSRHCHTKNMRLCLFCTLRRHNSEICQSISLIKTVCAVKKAFSSFRPQVKG